MMPTLCIRYNLNVKFNFVCLKVGTYINFYILNLPVKKYSY